MPWTDDYIGLPFLADGRSRAGLDCWGLVRLVYFDRLGIDLPSKAGIYRDGSRDTLREIAAAMEAEAAKWRQVDDPRDCDVILMRSGPLHCHVGLWVGRNAMLHIMAGIDSTVEPIASLRRRNTVVGYFRHD
ncbi:hypothetical protein A6A04_13495 [Paramagnetospirillum marisnigri]|uniref:NlpC/P60 domain-containing protein n=1 Tax=Paramagnetospirillum marisnigri TaxID=1285242 RepID=A0A178MV83_9PROT|nr:NlpC/P60 family protein [Paramagnetospirillum marisnigri]OAN53901.1 hypothetical protein A6A04_13495 [Paramagnetospirillum marisnigri]